MKEKIFLVIAMICIVVLGFVCVNDGKDKVVGGDRDENGCLGSAGYTWNSTEQECVKEWEEGEERYQVTDFISCEQSEYPVGESYPRQCWTPSGKHFVEEI